MTPEQIERVFGRGRLKMATGAHVEVFREAVSHGERRRYTKRFLVTDEADFGAWTEREWRILARLIGHGILCVPDVVQFDAGALGGMRRVQTYDAGITVDQWATLLPVSRDGVVHRSVFDDCAHWWALAHHCLAALNEIHALQLVHLDVKGDNICIPYGPPHFEPQAHDTTLYAVFARLALIDFAFSLVSGERLGTPLPIGWQKDYDYQSPRLLAALEAGRRGDLRPTQELDWRCDLYSLAAMLKRYLPAADEAQDDATGAGWTASRYDDARALIYRLRECHDRDLPSVRPHQELMDYTGARVRERDLALSLTRGWSLARNAAVQPASRPLTPLTRIVAPSHAADADRDVPPIVLPTAATAVVRRPRARVPTRTTAVIRRPRAGLPKAAPLVPAASPIASSPESPVSLVRMEARAHRSQRHWRAAGVVSAIGAAAALAAPSFIGDPGHPLLHRLQETIAAVTSRDPGKSRLPTQSPLPETASHADSSPSTNDGSPPQSRAAPSRTDVAAATPAKPASMASESPVSTAATPPAGEPPVSTATTPPASETRAPSSGPMPPANERIKLAEAKPKADASAAVGRPASAPSDRARQAARAEAPKSIAAAATSHEPFATKANRASTARSAQHEAPPPVLAAHAPKAVHPAAPAPRMEIATAAPSVGAFETATANSPKFPVETRVEGETSTTAPTSTQATRQGETPGAAVPDQSASVDSSAEAHVASAPNPARPRERSRPKAVTQGPLAELLSIFAWRQRAAPVEERSFGSSKAVEQTRRPSPRSQPTQNADSSTSTERPSGVPTTIASASAPHASTSPSPAVTAPLQVVTAPMAAAAFPVAKNEASAIPAQPSPAPESPAGSGAPEVRASTPPPPAGDVGSDSPRMSAVESRSVDVGVDQLALQGRQLVTRVMPDLATRAYDDLYPVLSMVSAQPDARQDRAITNALHAPWRGEGNFVSTTNIAVPRARRLHEEAWNGYVHGRSADDVLRLELAAFAANPRDPDIAGFLALLQLHVNNANPESARQLALHAIAMSGGERVRRVDDWSTLAIASALAGRHKDATRLFLVQVALAADVDRSCRAALLAYSDFGEPLRAPVQAMLARVHADPRAYEYPSCNDRSTSTMALPRTRL